MQWYVTTPDGRTFGPYYSKPQARVMVGQALGRNERLPRGTTWSNVPPTGAVVQSPTGTVSVPVKAPSAAEADLIGAAPSAGAIVTPAGGDYRAPHVTAGPVVPVTTADLSAAAKAPDCWALLASVMGGAMRAAADGSRPFPPNVLLFGPPGTGKTFAAVYYWLEAIGRRAIRVQLHDDSDAAATGGGHWTLQKDGFEWMAGHLSRGWAEGRRVVVDEIGRANGAVLDAMLQFLERPESAVATLDNGDTVTPVAGFHVIATTNGTPDDLDPALRDRFALALEIDRPHPDALAALPEDLRMAASGRTSGGLQTTVRQWRNFADLRATVGNAVAAQAVFGKDAAPDLLNALRLAQEAGSK